MEWEKLEIVCQQTPNLNRKSTTTKQTINDSFLDSSMSLPESMTQFEQDHN